MQLKNRISNYQGEIRNQNKIVRNLVYDLESLQERLDQIGQPDYVSSLRAKINQLDQSIVRE